MSQLAKDCLNNVRVLIVDDIEMNAWIAANVLQHHGASCESVSSGRQALDRLMKNSLPRIDVVLLDLHMPEMDGFEVAIQIRQTLGLEELPLIAYTTAVFGDTELQAEHAGINGVIYKPVVPEHLVTACLKSLPQFLGGGLIK